MRSSATSRSKSHRCRCRRSWATTSGSWYTTGSPNSCRRTAPRWCSSIPGAWPNARRGTWASAWAGRRSPRITAAWPRSCGSTPSNDSSAASCACWWRLPRWNWASTSAMWTWSASSVRRVRSPRCCSEWAAPGTTSVACPRGACSRSRATTWSNAWRCWTACAAANWTRWRSHGRRWTCCRSRSSPKSRPPSGRRTRYSRWCAVRGRTRSWRAAISTRWCACSPTASPRVADRARATCIATPCSIACAAGATRA